MSKTQDFIVYAQKYIPQFKIAFKDQSNFMKLLGRLLFFIPMFMSNFTTTIGYTVYLPFKDEYEKNPERYLDILTHEFVHMMDYRKYGLLFQLSYVVPQVLIFMSVFSLLAIWFSPLWLFSLIALIFLAPLPAYFRTYWELRGYTMNAAYEYWVSNETYFGDPQGYVDMFITSSYYWMWPFKKNISKKLQNMLNKIYDNSILNDEPYKIIHNWIMAQNGQQ